MSTKLLKDLNFAEKISAGQAITEAGKELLNKYKAYVYSYAPTCAVVNGFIAESSKYGFDNGLMSVVNECKQFINENNVSWKLASACESISNNNSTYNYINKLGVEQVSKLLEMNEADVVSYIKAGVLKNIQYIPEFRQICKEVYKQSITEAQAVNYNVVNPISFVYMTESCKYFNVCGKTYKIEDDKVYESVCDDVNYNKFNKLLESFSRNGDKLELGLKDAHGNQFLFSISEGGIDVTRTGYSKPIKEHFAEVSAFGEYANTLSKIMTTNEKLSFMQATNLVTEMFNNFANVAVLDNVKLLNANNGTICAIIEAKDNVNLTVFRNIKYGTSSQSYDYMVEALNQVVKLTGIDLKSMFEDRINEDCKKLDPEAQELAKQIAENKEAQFDIRKKKIAMLAEQYKNDPVKIALLSKVAKDLSILEKSECKDCQCTGKEDCECPECKKKKAKKEEEKQDKD